MKSDEHTDFGYRTVHADEKRERVDQVFSSVAPRYELMNDLMSLGMHRVWRHQALFAMHLRPGMRVLDLAGGTGHMSRMIYRRLSGKVHIVICDINAEMIRQGRDRLLDRGICQGIDYVRADAEHLPFADYEFDLVVIAFGLRNITDRKCALASIHRKLRYGGQLLILEFSQLDIPLLSRLYDAYSFGLIPLLGKVVAGDAGSYRYLVESIRKYPAPGTLVQMLHDSGFEHADYLRLSGGLVNIHRAYKL